MLNSTNVAVRWDPMREDDLFFLQSAHLYAQFYDLQIAIHRPFITPLKPSHHSFPAGAICANAARSCAHIIARVSRRSLGRTIPFLMARFLAFYLARGPQR
jgi:hypothetical protein